MSRWDEVEAKDTIAGNGCYVKLSPIVVIPAKAGISAPVQIPHGFAAIYIPAKLGAGMTRLVMTRTVRRFSTTAAQPERNCGDGGA